MAKRRMISCTIVGINEFIMLPKAAQALYFHLIANADDDGIVEGDAVMRLVRARRRDLEALTSAGYVYVLEPASNILYIPGWQSNNTIYNYRGTASIYRETLIEHFPAMKDALFKPRTDKKSQQIISETEEETKTTLGERETTTTNKSEYGRDFLARVGSATYEKPSLKSFNEVAKSQHIKLSADQIETIYEYLQSQDFYFSGKPIENLGKVLRWYEKNPDAIVGPQFPDDDNYVTGIIEW